MAEHWWLGQRAIYLQQLSFGESETCQDPKQLALYLRYQTTHDRGFHKCLNELLRLRAQKRKEEIGFVSQKEKEADQARKQELHEARVRLANARASHLEIDSDIRQTIQAPLPGHARLAFEDVAGIFKTVMNEFNGEYRAKLEEKAAA